MGKFKPKLILLDSHQTVRDHAKEILTKAGWDVFCEETPHNALNMLEQSKEYLFALFISNCKLPEMEGDDILEKVKSISPVTRRMLIVPFDRTDILISAVNKAEIHACITFPFKDEDLIAQAGNCFKQFKAVLKRQRLKRVTAHQNKQMLKIAQKLKKKDDAYKELIDGKKTKKLMLISKLEKEKRRQAPGLSACLSDVLVKKDINTTPDDYYNEFLSIFDSVKKLFDKAILHHQSETIPLNLKDIMIQEKEEGKTIGGIEPVSDGLMEAILKTVVPDSAVPADRLQESLAESDSTNTEKVDHPLDTYFEITVSDSRTKAYIKKIKEFDDNCPPPAVQDLLEFLMQKQVLYGLLDNSAIGTWISDSFAEKIVIARGEKPVYGQDGKIDYYFQTDFTNPGKINEDGTIDFRDRGNIPYVHKGDLLAEKTPPKESQPGVSVTGSPIPVEKAADPVFLAGPGTELTEDRLGVRAVIDGQPHRDALGTITVNSDLIIPGDVDFSTGNIDFKGNIIVKGAVREGFIVRGINLTANEIQGATIDLSGDLNVSDGVRSSKISFHGNMYAKYLNYSIVKGFGNLVIQREIFGSDILLSGNCQNPSGHIISSQISAKLGIEAGKIGSPVSKPCKLKVGVSTHTEVLKTEMDEALEALAEKSQLLKMEIKKLEDQDQTLYREISEKAHVQDRTQLEIKELKKGLPDLEKSGDLKKLQETADLIRKLLDRAKLAEKALNAIFETQDKLAAQIEKLKTDMARIEGKAKALTLEKQALADFSNKDIPEAVLKVGKTITVDTIVKGPHSSIVLKEDRARCKIHEITVNENNMNYHEMIISDP